MYMYCKVSSFYSFDLMMRNLSGHINVENTMHQLRQAKHSIIKPYDGNVQSNQFIRIHKATNNNSIIIRRLKK